MSTNANYSELQDSSDTVKMAEVKRKVMLRTGGCCGGCILILGLLYFVAKWKIGSMAADGFLNIQESKVKEGCGDDVTMENLVENIFLPGYGIMKNLSSLNDVMEPCFSDVLIKEWDTFNKKNGGQKVFYPSRSKDGIDTVTLGGWWLPADPAKGNAKSPRIVLQHGFTANSNKYRTMYAAYLLRSLGFNVLMNNFRDHCYSGSGTGQYEWGHAYPYDLLGAWDYAVNDPDNIMGGPLDASMVGLMGFSKGAFTTGNAFGLEGRVPAAWVDGPPFTPEEVFQTGFATEAINMAGPLNFLLTGLFGDSSWSAIEARAADHGIDLDDNLPKKVLPKGPRVRRPIQWVHNKQDDTVPYAEGKELEALLNSMPEQYDLSTLKFDQKCTPKGKSHRHSMWHCADHLVEVETYKLQLCFFWKKVFMLDLEGCDEATKMV